MDNTNEPTSGPPVVPLRETRKRGLADEWALVLMAEQIRSTIRAGGGGFTLWVREEDEERAEAALAAYEHENPPRPPPPKPVVFDRSRLGLLVPLLLVFFFLHTGARNPGVDWFERGSANAERILSGETWRTVTALTLHSDLTHVLANALSGALFLTALFGMLGPGVGLALVVLSGSLGNLLNAFFQPSFHDSVGASTAVFGAVGLLCGLAVARRSRGEATLRRAWVPIAAGLGMLAMLGTTGARVDLWAHLFGLAVGALLGVPVGFALERPPGSGAQWLAGGSTLLALLYCWGLALD